MYNIPSYCTKRAPTIALNGVVGPLPMADNKWVTGAIASIRGVTTRYGSTCYHSSNIIPRCFARPQLHHVTAAGHLLAQRLRSLRRSKDGSAWVQQRDNRDAWERENHGKLEKAHVKKTRAIWIIVWIMRDSIMTIAMIILLIIITASRYLDLYSFVLYISCREDFLLMEMLFHIYVMYIFDSILFALYMSVRCLESWHGGHSRRLEPPWATPIDGDLISQPCVIMTPNNEIYYLDVWYWYHIPTSCRGWANLDVVSTHFHAANLKDLTLQPVDAIITSPPYPGVYDYLSTADVAITLGLRLGGFLLRNKGVTSSSGWVWNFVTSGW